MMQTVHWRVHAQLLQKGWVSISVGNQAALLGILFPGALCSSCKKTLVAKLTLFRNAFRLMLGRDIQYKLCDT